MANLIDTGMGWLAEQLNGCAGRSATYRRGGRRISLTIVRAAQDETVVDANGIPITVRDHEVKVDVTAIPWEPQSGDIIEETIGGQSVRWEVTPRGDGPAWEWWDDARQAYRVFVQEV